MGRRERRPPVPRIGRSDDGWGVLTGERGGRITAEVQRTQRGRSARNNPSPQFIYFASSAPLCVLRGELFLERLNRGLAGRLRRRGSGLFRLFFGFLRRGVVFGRVDDVRLAVEIVDEVEIAICAPK